KINDVPLGPKFLATLFGELAERGIVVDIITQSQNDHASTQRLAFSIPEEDITQTEAVLKKVLGGATYEILGDMAKISVIGVGMKNHPGVAARFFKVLEEQSIGVHLVTTSDIKISAVVGRNELKAAAEALHTEFNLDK